MAEATAVVPLGAATLNRDWRVEVNTGTVATPVWTVIRGRTDGKPGIDNTLQDDSDMDSGGWKSQTKTAQQWTMELKLVRKAVASILASGTSTYDAGQEALRLAGDAVGPYNTVHLRWFKLGAVRTEAYTGFGAVTWSPDGGAMDGLDTVSVTIAGQGQRTAITHPYTLP